MAAVHLDRAHLDALDEFLAERKPGDTVSGRVVELTGSGAVIELGEGIRATCRTSKPSASAPTPEAQPTTKADLSSLTSMLSARWKGNAPAESAQPEPLAEGQVRSFRITKVDAAAKKIELELA